ncbi:zinc finger protein 358 [Drosophila pseudoobscura]|uniref:Zinc finger protein 358 n=1 Tax=Drosophila pseudoobscura pseudoobscura TaxID=46245 RepID=A0A6I8URQ9_DROPS|nr:zinc finger protein 358 [Drosophila pseudoobscura]
MDRLQSLCRICIVNPEDDSLIATGEDFDDLIKCCTGIQLSVRPNGPRKICISCELLIRSARQLRSLCQESDEKLKKYESDLELLEAKRNVANEDDISIDSDMEMVHEYLDSYVVSQGSPESTTESHFSEEISIKRASPAPVEQKPPCAVASVKQKPQSTSTLALSPDSIPATELKPSKAPRFACHVCPNVYLEKSKLTVHLLAHNDFKRHECEICQKGFHQTTSLKRHMNTHTGQRPYKCFFCDSRFADPSTRIKHERIHTNEKPYKCKFCGKVFAYSNVLRGHLKTHTGERPYKCQHCKQSFSQMHHKNAHEKSHRMKDTEDTITVIAVEEE